MSTATHRGPRGPRLPLPALAAAAAGPTGLLVARRRSRVLHVALPTRSTATRLPRADRPLCGRSSRSWSLVAPDGRPLCRTCAAALTRRGADPLAPTVPALLPPATIEATIRTAEAAALDAVVLLVSRAPACGRYTPLVRARRDELAQRRRLAAAQAEHDRLLANAS